MSHRVLGISLLPVAALATMGFTRGAAAAARAGGLPWWGWLLIIVAIVALAYLIWWYLGRQRSTGGASAPSEAARVSKPAMPAAAAAPVGAMEPEAEIAPAIAAEPAEPDDLKRIEGIGPKVAELLNQVGIATYAELAASDLSSVQEVLQRAKLPMIDPSSWAEQAALAAEAKWDELTALQDALKGGRRA